MKSDVMGSPQGVQEHCVKVDTRCRKKYTALLSQNIFKKDNTATFRTYWRMCERKISVKTIGEHRIQ